MGHAGSQARVDYGAPTLVPMQPSHALDACPGCVLSKASCSGDLKTLPDERMYSVLLLLPPRAPQKQAPEMTARAERGVGKLFTPS